MPIEVYDSVTLLGVVESLDNPPITFLRDRYFPGEQLFDTPVVGFDVMDKARRIAPFVSPLVKGKVVERRGFNTKFFRPAYIKPKNVINPWDALPRTAGEPLTGNLSLEERHAVHVRAALAEHVEMLDMREEVMASEILRTGKLTIEGEGFGVVVMDFGRDPTHTVTLTGNDRWSVTHADSDPIGDINTWALRVRTNSKGAVVRDIVMEPTAFSAFLARLSDAQREQFFNSLRGSGSTVELGPRLAEKVRFEGIIGQYNIWTYSDTYLDEDGNEQQVMPAGQVLMVSTAVEGVRAYGAILDVNMMRAARIWPKQWQEQDPSQEFVMSQSAPLLAPLRPNASLAAKVL